MTGSPESHPLSDFVGRKVEVEAVIALAMQHRLVSVVGPGGIGKTRLASQVYARCASKLEGFAWNVELADVVDPELVRHAVASAMGIAVMSTSLDLRVLSDHIGVRPALLFLDNCEHLVAVCAELVAGLVKMCPNLHVLLTSRQSLGVIGERLYPVKGLRGSEAMELFIERALSVLPDWTPSPGERTTVRALCERVEGSPLAIEVVAAQVRTFTPAMMLSRIVGGNGGIKAWGLPTVGRQTSLSACMTWSYELCTPDEARLWERSAVFGGGFSLEAAENVCVGDGLERPNVVGALAGLVDKSLVERDIDDPAGRYRMHEMVRQLGLAKLEDRDETPGWRRRHRDYFLEVAADFDAAWIGANQHEWIDRLRREKSNLGQAFEFSLADPQEAPAALRMAVLLEPYYACSDTLGVVLHWLRQALNFQTGSDFERAEALRFGCHMATILTDGAVARQMYDEASQLAARSDDDRVRASALYAACVYRTFTSEADVGAAVAAEGIERFGKIGDLNRHAYLLYLQGKALGMAGRHAEAELSFRECLRLTRPRGERWMSSYATWGLGLGALATGRVDQARELLREALKVKAEFEDHLGIGLILEALAWTAIKGRSAEVAAFLTGAADAIWASLGTSLEAMPYLSERRAASTALVHGMLTDADYEQFHEAGRTTPQQIVIVVALGEAPVPVRGAPSALTAREYEIALLAASGATNRDIAGQLVLSVRTVESHVESVLRKLGVRSRSDIAPHLRVTR